MSILQALLNEGLVDIGSDDTRLAKMELAVAALAKAVGDDPSLLISTTLVALDEEVGENDPAFDLVEGFVASEWKTLRNTHVNRPRTLLRSIIVSALGTAVTSSPYAAAIIWNTAASLIRHNQTRPGRAATSIDAVLREARQAAERAAISALAPPTEQRAAPAASKPAPPNSHIADADVLKDVWRAAGPQNAQGQPNESPNPHWPNSAQAWSNEFAPRMAAALANAVNLGGDRVAKRLESTQGPVIDQVARISESARVRLDVLWWSQAMYSPKLAVGYRELAPKVAAVVAAVDLASILPALAPASACYVLGETVARLGSEKQAEGKGGLVGVLEELSRARVDIGDLLAVDAAKNGRVPLLHLIADAFAGQKTPKDQIKVRTGVSPTLALSPAELSMWAFRDIQARRLARAGAVRAKA